MQRMSVLLIGWSGKSAFRLGLMSRTSDSPPSIGTQVRAFSSLINSFHSSAFRNGSIVLVAGLWSNFLLFGGRMKCPCRPGLDCESVPQSRRPYLIPSRFIAICPKGHIEDFPFMEWVHRDGKWDRSHKLRLLAGRSSASLSGIKVACSCGKSETMAGSFNFDSETGGALHKIGYDCSESTPWLGRGGGRAGTCGEYLRVVQRGASNVYFPLTVSSIYLPSLGRGDKQDCQQSSGKPQGVGRSGGGPR